MKNIFAKVTLLCLFTVGLVGCEEDRVTLDYDGGPTQWAFAQSESSFPVLEEGVSTTYVNVGVTTTSGSAREIPVSIDPASTALAAEYSIEASSLYIPAGAVSGSIKITGNFDALPDGVEKQLIFTFNEGVSFIDDQNFHIVNIFRACPIVRDEFIGTYDAVEDGTATYQVTAVAGSAPNELILSNVWDVDPASQTRIFLGDDVTNPIVTYPMPAFTGTNGNVAANYLYNNSQYGPAYVVGLSSSNFNSCQKVITLDFNVRVQAGTFAATNLVLTKVAD